MRLIYVDDSIMFKGVQDGQDVQDPYILYELTLNGRNLYLYAFKMFRRFKIRVLFRL